MLPLVLERAAFASLLLRDGDGSRGADISLILLSELARLMRQLDAAAALLNSATQLDGAFLGRV